MSTIAPYNGPVAEFPAHSLFDKAVEAGHAARVVVQDDAGEYYGWQFVEEQTTRYRIAGPERLALAGMRAASTSYAAELAASAAAGAALQSKLNVARNAVRGQVARVKQIAPGARTDQDKWLLALSLLLLAEE